MVYLAFWLGLGLLYSTVTKKTSTSILMSVATWLFCSIVVTIVASLVANTLVQVPMPMGGFDPRITQTTEYSDLLQRRSAIQTSIQRISPASLYSEAVSSILGQTTGGGLFGFMGLGRGAGIPFQSLGLTQGIIATWPQITAMAVGLVVCFAISYMLFLRLEIRPGA